MCDFCQKKELKNLIFSEEIIINFCPMCGRNLQIK
jgi:NMD protein affecting ribosome stability and mRNA decay